MRHRASRVRRFLLVSTTAGAVFTAAACEDATAPRTPPRAEPATSALASGAMVVVSPADMRGWSFVHQATGKPCVGAACAFVSGPMSPPFGTGSVELSAANGAEASISLPAYRGTRLGRITTLRYSTFRRSPVNRANGGHGANGVSAVNEDNDDNDAHGTHGPDDASAVALELLVDLDPAAPARASVARLVFEPSRGGGAVKAGTWQSWDARAGLWWLSHEGAHGTGGADRPCVEGRPCTWTALLRRYPDIAVHSTSGAVLLTAGRSRDSRGNADGLVVGVDGIETTYDFELVAAPAAKFALRAAIGETVVRTTWPTDTSFVAGARVSYAFTARPGRAVPVVVLDDTIAPASGVIVMDRAHTLLAESDTIYTYEGLLPMERQFADLTRALLTSSDKVAATQAILDHGLALRLQGADGDSIARASAVAEFVVMDPERDSTALRQIEDALVGQTLYAELTSAGSFRTWTEFAPTTFTSGARSPTGTPTASRAPAGSGLHAGPRAAGARPSAAPSGASRELGFADGVSVPIDGYPPEKTSVIYTNGIRSTPSEAAVSTAVLAGLLLDKPYVRNGSTRIALSYNRTAGQQLADFTSGNPCVKRAMWRGAILSAIGTYGDFAGCRSRGSFNYLTSTDFAELISQGIELWLRLPPSNDDVQRLAHLVAAERSVSRDRHVLLVAHSQGTMIGAQAIRLLPQLEGHELQVANTCVGAVAMASPGARSMYDLDDNHVFGFIAEHDIARGTGNWAGWQSVSTPLTEQLGQLMAVYPNYQLLSIPGRLKIHGVLNTYLTGRVGSLVADRVTQLHTECVVASANLLLSTPTVRLGETYTARALGFNAFGRELRGLRDKWIYAEGDPLDSMTYRIMLPQPNGQGVAQVKGFMMIRRMSFPPLALPTPVYEDSIVNGWGLIVESNGSYGLPWSHVAPTTRWDGASVCTDNRVRIDGPEGAYAVYQMNSCGIIHTVTNVPPDVLPTGYPVSTMYSWHATTPDKGEYVAHYGPQFFCERAGCLIDVHVDQYVGSRPDAVATSRPPMTGASLRAPTPALKSVRVPSRVKH